MELQCGVFLAEREDDLRGPGISALRHTGQEIRETTCHQLRNLGRQCFFQLHAANGGFIIAPRKFLRPVAGESAAFPFHTHFSPKRLTVQLRFGRPAKSNYTIAYRYKQAV